MNILPTPRIYDVYIYTRHGEEWTVIVINRNDTKERIHWIKYTGKNITNKLSNISMFITKTPVGECPVLSQFCIYLEGEDAIIQNELVHVLKKQAPYFDFWCFSWRHKDEKRDDIYSKIN